MGLEVTRTASFLGGVAFFAALVLFLHRTWGSLPTWGHVAILIAMPLALLGATELAVRQRLHT